MPLHTILAKKRLMITAPDIPYSPEFYINHISRAGILQDDERESIIFKLSDTESELKPLFLSITNSLLFPTTAPLFEDGNTEESKRFVSELLLTGTELAIALNRISQDLRAIFRANAPIQQILLEEIYWFYETFYHTSYEVGHDFKYNPFSKMMDDWILELQKAYPDTKFSAIGEMQRLRISNAYKKVTNDFKVIPPLEWMGEATELAELFIELRKKGWIRDVAPSVIANAVIEMFRDVEYGTIYQYLKPGDKDFPHSQVYKKSKRPKFRDIVQYVPKPPSKKKP